VELSRQSAGYRASEVVILAVWVNPRSRPSPPSDIVDNLGNAKCMSQSLSLLINKVTRSHLMFPDIRA